MKRTQILYCLVLFISSAKSQNITKASVKTDLLHTWKVSYMENEGKQITAEPGAPVVTYEFHANNTLIVYANNKPKEKYNGKWSYNAVKQIINIEVNGRPVGSIISLSQDSMTLKIKTDSAPGSGRMLMIFVLSK
jgi:Lipocalin-like domain